MQVSSKISGKLAGKRALVTGASSGLGAHFAKVLSANGCEVVLAARRLAALNAVADEVSRTGKVSVLELDVTNGLQRDAVLEQAGVFDILINNAGVVRDKPAFAQDETDWDTVMDTNLKGLFFVAQSVARKMKEQGRGTIVNIASVLGLRQAGGVLPYAVSKAGVVQLTQLLALEWARFGIRVNALAPGYIETELNQDFWSTDSGKALVRRIPQRRLGQPCDLDGPLMLLASDESRYMTGSILSVDGGHLVSSL